MSHAVPSPSDCRSPWPASAITLGLRALTELGIVAGLAYWGFTTGDGAAMKILLGIAAPAIGFGFWGTVDFRHMGPLSEPLRLAQELAISGAAAVAWYVADEHIAGYALAGLSIVYHAVLYASGQRLLAASAPEP